MRLKPKPKLMQMPLPVRSLGTVSTDLANGLTKRELFAAMAMQGMLASGRPVSDETLSDATTAADALIEALNEQKEQP